MSAQLLSSLSSMSGWIYFTSWSCSFYPQIILNYQNKLITGLSLDYVLLNITGFSAYAIFTSLLYWMPVVRQEFSSNNGGTLPQVEFNDVVFAIHGVITTLIVAVQCVIYPIEARAPRVRPLVNVVCWVSALFMLLGFVLSYSSWLDWMLYIRFCGLLKFFASFTKYVPQVVLNFRRKSTEGFSISTIGFDFVGGVFSVSQQALSSLLQENLSPFTKNFAKSGLGLETLLFDTILMVQHFCLYNRRDYKIGLSDVEEDAPLVSAHSETL